MNEQEKKVLTDEYAKCVHDADVIRLKYQGKYDQMTADEEATFDRNMDRADAIEREIKIATKTDARTEWSKSSAGNKPPLADPGKGGPPTGRKADDDPQDYDPISGLKGVKFYEDGKIDSRLKTALIASNKAEYADGLEAYIRCFGDDRMMAQQAGKSEKWANALKALSEGTDVQGGFLVVPEFMNQLVKKLPAVTSIRQNARSFAVASDIVKFPKVNYTADDKFTSPVRITWVGENPSSQTTIDSPDANFFGQEIIPVNTAMAALTISNDLIEDAVFDVLAYLNDNLAEAYALSEDQVFAVGTGQGQPEGIITAAQNGKISYVPSTSASAITADSLIDLFYALPKQYRNMAAFTMSSQTAKPIRKLKDAQNRYLWDAMSVGGLTTNGDRDNLLGKPVFIDEFVPDAQTNNTFNANSFPIIFGDLKGYYIADRIGMSIQVLRETKAKLNQLEIVARRRVGGSTVEPFRFRVMKIAVS